jgi:hypothetical protein
VAVDPFEKVINFSDLLLSSFQFNCCRSISVWLLSLYFREGCSLRLTWWLVGWYTLLAADQQDTRSNVDTPFLVSLLIRIIVRLLATSSRRCPIAKPQFCQWPCLQGQGRGVHPWTNGPCVHLPPPLIHTVLPLVPIYLNTRRPTTNMWIF